MLFHIFVCGAVIGFYAHAEQVCLGGLMKPMVADLKEGSAVDSLFSVKYKRGVVAYANGWRFAFGASDRTGEVETSYWGGTDKNAVQAVHDSFKEGDVVRVRGTVAMWKDRLKIDVNEGRGDVTAARQFSIEDFLPATDKNVEQLYVELLSLVDAVKHEGLRRTLEAFFKDPEFARGFKRAPGAMYLHHAWLGGLMEHSIAVANIALAAAKYYEDVDADLVIAGALLHDVGKMRELQVTTNIKVGEEGMLRGHTVIGEEMVREKAKSVGLDGHMLLKLSHSILSHHGAQENGAPRKPMTVEAVLVYFADDMDAKASFFANVKEKTNTEDFRVYDRHWGEIYLQ